jgi:hypothetical protein
MSNPSLLCVPYRFKTSKLYSQIPDSGLGDFVVTRATTPTAGQATRVNAAGLIELVADNVPRLDYPLGGITAGCPALLVEPSGTNLCPRSQEINLWTPNAATATPNAAISPDGTQNAELFVPNSGTNGRVEINVGTLTNATTYTMTCFMKQHTASLDQITLYVSDGGGATGTHRWGVNVSLSAFTLSNYTQSNGSVTSTSIENYGNGWYRIRVTGQVTSGMASTSAVVIRYFGSTANGTNGVLVFGAQFETGSIATSYIPTAASSVTRGADTISKTGISSLIGQTEGTIYLEVEQDPLNRDIFSLNTGTGNSIIFYKNSSNIVNARLYANSSTIFTIANAVATNGFVKIALAYKAGDSAMVINAGTAQTSASSFIFSSALSLVSLTPSWFTNAGFTKIRAVALYPTRLPNTGPLSLQSLTQ